MGLSQPALLPVISIQASAELIPDLQWKRAATGSDLPPANLSTEDRAVAERRFTVIEPLVVPDKFPVLWRSCGGRKLAVVAAMAEQHSHPTRTIRHWLTQYRRHGMLGLVNRDRADKGTFKLNKAAQNLLWGLAIPKRGVFGSLSCQEISRAYEEERVWRDAHIGLLLHGADIEKYALYLEDGKLPERVRLPKISSKTIWRFVNSIPEAVRTLARDGKEAYQNTQEIISHRALADMQPLDTVVMDDRLLDVFCLIPERGGFKLARPWLCAALCMRTRRFLAWGIFQVPSSDAIATVLKKVFIQHGVPKEVYYDNGKTYRSQFLEGRHLRNEQANAIGELDPAWRGVLGTLGVRVRHAIPYRARSKSIEANFTRIATIDKELPEYCGNKPTARPERFDEMVKQHELWTRGLRTDSPFRTIQQIATYYEAAIADLNERELEGEGMRKVTPNGYGWMSPNECWDTLIGRVERRTVRTEDLHIVFSRRRTLTVKHGEIAATFGGQKFHYRLEADPAQLMAINGQLVEVGFDPNELGQVAVYWRDSFVGLAHCVALRKMGTDAFVDDEKVRQATRRDLRKLIEVVHQAVPVSSPEERLARRGEIRPLRESPARAEVPLELPAAIEAAAKATAEQESFSFFEAAGSIAAVEVVSAADDSQEDETFHFFSDVQGD